MILLHLPLIFLSLSIHLFISDKDIEKVSPRVGEKDVEIFVEKEMN